jgi:hypothetical protein
VASVLLEEETGVPEENHRLAASHRQTLSHKVVSNTPLLSGILTHNASYIFKCFAIIYFQTNVDIKHKSSIIANVQIKFPICIYCHKAIYLVLKYITSVVS